MLCYMQYRCHLVGLVEHPQRSGRGALRPVRSRPGAKHGRYLTSDMAIPACHVKFQQGLRTVAHGGAQ